MYLRIPLGPGGKDGGKDDPSPLDDLALDPAMIPMDRCLEIAEKNRSPLFQASRLFLREKRDLFLASYAAMRLVDDLVDEGFLASQDQSPQRIARVKEQIEQWRCQAEAAAMGSFSRSKDSFDPLVFEALNETVGRSNLGKWPWNALASAMVADVEGRSLETWSDFLEYAEGATVAPATVFLHILACEPNQGRYESLESPLFYREKVREMAIFCYLVHIVRDLAKDASSSGQLVTIPNQVLAQTGLDKSSLATLLREDPQKVIPLKRVLLQKAHGFLHNGMDKLMTAAPLKTLEKKILQHLMEHYTGPFREMTHDVGL